MEKFTLLLDKVISLENNLRKLENVHLKNLISKQIYKLKKIILSLNKQNSQYSYEAELIDIISRSIVLIESLVLRTDTDNLYRKIKQLEDNIESFVKRTKNDIYFVKKLVEIGHILDEVTEIVEILSKKIPD